MIINELRKKFGTENEAAKFRDKKQNSALLKIALVLVLLDHVASIIVNANHGIV